MPYDIDMTMRESVFCIESFIKEINRQKTDIDRLKELLEEWKTEAYKVADEKDELYCDCVDRVMKAKAEAVKEVINKAKKKNLHP